MFKELLDIADQAAVCPEGYGFVAIHVVIDLNTGQVILQKRNYKAISPEIRRNATKPLLINDALEYVLGIGERGAERYPVYMQLLEECFNSTKNQDVRAVINWCQKHHGQLPPELAKEKEPDRLRVAFLINKNFITNQKDIKSFWVSKVVEDIETRVGLCKLTGKSVPLLLNKVPVSIKGVSGSNSTGACLISFDKDAFTAYGWDGVENAHIGYEAISMSHKVLNELLSHKTPDSVDDKKPGKYTNQYRLGDDLTVVYWSSDYGTINPDFWDDPDSLYQSKLKSLFISPLTGEVKTLPLAEKFYLLFLKGNTGRISIEGFFESNVGNIKNNIDSFLEQANCPIWQLSSACFGDKLSDSDKSVKGRIQQGLFRSMLFGVPIPDNFAYRVLYRCGIDGLSPSRVKALKVYLQRKNMTPESQNVAYNLGKMAFAIHYGQNPHDVDGESNVTRCLGALSRTPARVLPRLQELFLKVYLPKLEIKHKRCKEMYFKSASQIPEVSTLTKFNNLEQCAFYLGFAHARELQFTKSDNSSSESTENTINNGESV